MTGSNLLIIIIADGRGFFCQMKFNGFRKLDISEAYTTQIQNYVRSQWR